MTIRQLMEARIKDQVPQFKEVAGASSIENVLKNAVSTPACYVFLDREFIKPNPETKAEYEPLWQSYTVLFAVQNVRDPRGSDASDECEALRDAVKNALIVDWQPAENTEVFRYRGGLVVPVKGSAIYFFKAIYEIRVYS
jgi:hypothetical protein